MRIERLFTHRLIQALRVLVPLLVVTLIAIPAWNYFSRRGAKGPPPHATALPSGLSLRTEGFTYAQTEGGRTIFTLKARTQLGYTDSKYMLEDVDVTVFGKAETDPVRTIHSKTCSYDEQSGSITCSDNVEVQLDEWTTLRTTDLTYNPSERVIVSNQRTVIDQPGTVNGRADRFAYSLDSGLLKLDGNVRAETVEGAALEAESALFNRKENWATVTGSVYLASTGGWIRGSTGRAELEPQTFKPKKILIEGGVTAHSDALDMHSGWLEATMSAAGVPETVKARENVEVERLGGPSREVLMGGEVDASLGATGRVHALEARNNARMVLGSDRTLTSTRIWTNGSSSVTTDANSVLEVGGARIEGRDFMIEQGDIVRFTTLHPATLQSGSTRSSAQRTEARFDSRTNQLLDLTQSGNFQFVDDQWKGNAGSARFEDGGAVVILTGSPTVSNSEMRLEAGRIRLNQKEKSFTAVTRVRTVRKDAGDPVLILADEAAGSSDSIVYTRNVELWRGKAHIQTDRLEANKDDRVLAEGNVRSSFDAIRASSGKLDYDGRQQVAHYTESVKVRNKDVAIDASDMTLTLDEKTNELSRIVARGAVSITRGEQRGTGDEAVYQAASDEVTLIGKPARVDDKQRGSVEGTRLIMNTKGTAMSVESAPGGRAVAKQNVKK